MTNNTDKRAGGYLPKNKDGTVDTVVFSIYLCALAIVIFVVVGFASFILLNMICTMLGVPLP